ncbi:hypothetical protein RFI_28051 [Reticulomyxa filosa]|uniref:Uncharacterized protein n=1 Tax=Reticulomyxa filosa TaxID=46433 RepID=X6M5X8_RETFI|nr:hypothetical protein RFI_28051 [Reticulomyxa filosa]|eukprot:ETO09334.1 hypothetical protein RFI_28051 [Reticulomyxa filosa]
MFFLLLLLLFKKKKKKDLKNSTIFLCVSDLAVFTKQMFREMITLASFHKDADACAKYLQKMKARGLYIRGKDRAQLAIVMGSPAEQLEARRRLRIEKTKTKKDNIIRQKAKMVHKGELRMKDWPEMQRKVAEKEAGIRLKEANRTTGKIFWNVNRTLGQLDDPW